MYPDADFQIRLRLGPQGLQRGYSDGRYISLAAGVDAHGCAPVADDAPRYDVIVVGGGTAGALAALTVAERGQNVLVVERLNCLGGMSTAGRIEGYYYGNRGGLYEQIDAEAKAYEPFGYAPSGVSSFNVELKKRVLENRLHSAGAELELEADLTGSYDAG